MKVKVGRCCIDVDNDDDNNSNNNYLIYTIIYSDAHKIKKLIAYCSTCIYFNCMKLIFRHFILKCVS